MSLETRELRAYVAVAEELSFVRAAQRLHVAQPALSRTISSLEARVGARLLDRTTRVVSLTQAGKIFLVHVRHMLDELDRAVQLAQDASVGLVGELRVGYMDFAVYGPMLDLLLAFNAEHPQVRLNLQRRRSDEQSDDVAAERLDFGFAIRHRFRDDVEAIPLTREPLVAVLPAGHRLANRARISIGDLADDAFIVGERSKWQLFLPIVEAFCASGGFAPRVSFEANEGDTIFRLVAAARGISIYPACAIRAPHLGIVVRAFEEEAPVVETFGLIRKARYSQVAERFVSLVRECSHRHS